MTEAITHIDHYSARRLSPFQGILQIIETSGARALSVDGINWQIQLRHKLPKPRWGSLDNVVVTRRYLRYGIWSRRESLSRLPLPPTADAKAVQSEAKEFLKILENSSPNTPFPIRDKIELWLLDNKDYQPLALLASALSRSRRSHIRTAEWFASLPHDRDTPLARCSEYLSHDLREAISKLVNGMAGSPARAQWFERDEAGSGIGFDGVRLDTSLINRHLPCSAFPILPLREDWVKLKEQQIVAAYHAWQAPWLLTLPHIADTSRAELERFAARQPLTVRMNYRLYPKIIDPGLINKALVEAEIRRAVIG